MLKSRRTENQCLAFRPVTPHLILIFTWNNASLHWRAHTASPLISEANFFISTSAIPLTSQDVNGLVIEAKFFSQSAYPLENNCFNCGFNTHQLKLPYLTVLRSWEWKGI